MIFFSEILWGDSLKRLLELVFVAQKGAKANQIKTEGKPNENRRKTMKTKGGHGKLMKIKGNQRNTKGKSKENRRKTEGKPKETERKTKGKPKENPRKTKGKPKGNQRKTKGKTEGKPKENPKVRFCVKFVFALVFLWSSVDFPVVILWFSFVLL